MLMFPNTLNHSSQAPHFNTKIAFQTIRGTVWQSQALCSPLKLLSKQLGNFVSEEMFVVHAISS